MPSVHSSSSSTAALIASAEMPSVSLRPLRYRLGVESTPAVLPSSLEAVSSSRYFPLLSAFESALSSRPSLRAVSLIIPSEIDSWFSNRASCICQNLPPSRANNTACAAGSECGWFCSGNGWKHSRVSLRDLSTCSSIGRAAAQYGHSKSENSTRVTFASFGPWHSRSSGLKLWRRAVNDWL